MKRARGFMAPLWEMAPSFARVAQICREARAHVIRNNPGTKPSRIGRAAMAEADRRLAAAHVYVEGA